MREFIASKVDKSTAQEYNKSIDVARQVQLNEENSKTNVVLKKEEQDKQPNVLPKDVDEKTNKSLIYILIGLIVILVVWFVFSRKRSK